MNLHNTFFLFFLDMGNREDLKIILQISTLHCIQICYYLHNLLQLDYMTKKGVNWRTSWKYKNHMKSKAQSRYRRNKVYNLYLFSIYFFGL